MISILNRTAAKCKKWASDFSIFVKMDRSGFSKRGEAGKKVEKENLRKREEKERIGKGERKLEKGRKERNIKKRERKQERERTKWYKKKEKESKKNERDIY